MPLLCPFSSIRYLSPTLMSSAIHLFTTCRSPDRGSSHGGNVRLFGAVHVAGLPVVAFLADDEPLVHSVAEFVRGLGLHAEKLRDGADGARGHDVLEVRHPSGADRLGRQLLEHRLHFRLGRRCPADVVRPHQKGVLHIFPFVQARTVEQVRQPVVRRPGPFGVALVVQVLLAVQHELVAGQEKRQEPEHEDVVLAPF